MPPIPIAIGGLIALSVIAFMAITSGVGGIISRIGRLIDSGSKNKEEMTEIKSTADKALTKESSLANGSTKKMLQHLQPQPEVTMSATGEDKTEAEQRQNVSYSSVFKPLLKRRELCCVQNKQSLISMPIMAI
jgi:hypothetical protein